MVKISVKNQNVRLLIELYEKWLSYKLNRFWVVFNFFWVCLTLSIPEKLKNTIFEIPIIPHILNMKSCRTTSAKSINLDIIKKFIEYSSKHFHVKAIFTFTVFEIRFFEGRSVLWLAHGAKGLKFQWKTKEIFIYLFCLFSLFFTLTFNNFNKIQSQLTSTQQKHK